MAIFEWNCNGWGEDKAFLLSTALEAAGVLPDVLVLTETHRPVHGMVMGNLRTQAWLQTQWSASAYTTASSLRASSGGVVVAVASGVVCLAAVHGAHFVAAALSIPHKGKVIVAGVYIPPRNSVARSARYGAVLDDIAEAVQRL